MNIYILPFVLNYRSTFRYHGYELTSLATALANLRYGASALMSDTHDAVLEV